MASRITAATGIKASTCVLGYRDLLRRTGARRIGLVSPYTDDVQARIAKVWSSEGFAITAERHCGLADNYSFCEITQDRIAEMSRAVVEEGCDAVVVLCTNMDGAAVAPRLEPELGVPIYDSVSVTLWEAMRAAGADPRRIQGWGRLFDVA